MAIPESQLETWSHQGSIAQSRTTYATIKRALEDANSPYAQKDYRVFLQGSYGNDTNIYSESDLDVVVELGSLVFYHDLDELPQEQKAAFEQAYSDVSYGYKDFRAEVLSQLRAQFDAAVKPGTKAIKVEAGGSRRNADVLAATQFRRYHRFNSLDDQQYDLGICFFTPANRRVANYPRQHSENCTTKHQATRSRFKPMVRVLKNLRSHLVDEGAITAGMAPSYYLEGLLYNVPDEKFEGSYQDALTNSMNWMLEVDRSEFVCANEQYYLLRDDTHVTWSAAKCTLFLTAAAECWGQW